MTPIHIRAAIAGFGLLLMAGTASAQFGLPQMPTLTYPPDGSFGTPTREACTPLTCPETVTPAK